MDTKKNTIKDLIFKIILLIFSTLLAVVISEIICRLTMYKYLSLSKPITFPRYYFQKDKDSGYDLSNNFPCQRFIFTDSSHLIWTNELGCFDNPYNREKDYILLLGDSFTWGFTSFECKFGTLIEKLLGSRVLKCGVPGYGLRHELIKIKKITAKTKSYPKLIILCYFLENDFLDDWLFPGGTVINGRLMKKVDFDNLAEKRYFIPEDELVKIEREWQRYENFDMSAHFFKKIQSWLRLHSLLYHLIVRNQFVKMIAIKFGLAAKIETDTNIGLRNYLYSSNNYQDRKGEWLKHFNNVKEIKKVADSYNSKLLLILIPTKYQVYDFLPIKFNKKYIFNDISNLLQDYFAGDDIFFLDLTPLFRKYADLTSRKHLSSQRDLYWEHDWHWNVKGNKLAALLTSDFIIENNLIEIKDIEVRQKIKQKIEEELNGFKDN